MRISEFAKAIRTETTFSVSATASPSRAGDARHRHEGVAVKKRKQREGVAFVLATVIASPPFLAGCGALAGRTAPAVGEASHRLPTRQLVIAQIRYGNDARYELCPVDACPKPTPKTLVGHAQAPAAPIPLAVPSLPNPLSASPPPAAQIAPMSPAAFQSVSETSLRPTVDVKTIVVTFASGSGLLTAAARRQLAAIVPDARRSRAIEIRGRTDEFGSVAFNELLARNRALAVRDYLRAQNLPEETTLHLSFKGACCYVAGNDTADGRAANRRVEIEWQPGLKIAQRTTHEQH